MKLPRAIAALGMAFALSFGLMLAPSQADATTLTINPRANAVEAGQILAAPTGSVFTITVYDLGLPNKSKNVTHTYQTGDTLRQTANKLARG